MWKYVVMNNQHIADLLFPDVKESIGDIKSNYPDRPSGQLVTRFAPSPTGFLHLGSLFAWMVPWLVARQNQGVFILRIEDTDQNRKVENGITFMSQGLRDFWIEPDEWRISETEDRWDYWSYLQSERLDYYRVFLKHLVATGYAYPCRMSSDEIDQVRQIQKVSKQMPGIYGNYSQRRWWDEQEIIAKIASGDAYVIRLRSPGEYGQKRTFKDVIRWDVNMQEHFQDSVLLKSDWYPTYHLAHLVDDYLMGTTHVIRAEEWLASVPLHVQLFECCWLQAPQYAHLAQLLKTDDGKKRKLSKRKDPEADVKWLVSEWFAKQWILEYLMTIVSPNYEGWQQENVDAFFADHLFELSGMNKSWALVDIVKMEQVNREYLSRLTDAALYQKCFQWSEVYHADFHALLQTNPDYMTAAMWIERHTPKDPKRFARYNDVYDQLLCFDDDLFNGLEYPDFSEKLTQADAEAFLADYKDEEVFLSIRDDVDDTSWDALQARVQEWFAHLREIGQKHKFAINNAAFKEWWWKWKTWDLAMLLRIVLCKAWRTPDLYSVMKVMGKERVLHRIDTFLNA